MSSTVNLIRKTYYAFKKLWNHGLSISASSNFLPAEFLCFLASGTKRILQVTFCFTFPGKTLCSSHIYPVTGCSKPPLVASKTAHLCVDTMCGYNCKLNSYLLMCLYKLQQIRISFLYSHMTFKHNWLMTLSISIFLSIMQISSCFIVFC